MTASDAQPTPEPPPCATGPSRLRGIVTILILVTCLGWLTLRVDTGIDPMVTKLGRVEVLARLMDRPEAFPQLGAYRYTYVLRYQVLKVFRADAKRPLQTGDTIFVGHYKPWMPRAQIKDSDWGKDPLGGKLDQFTTGEVHRMALDYELADLAPSGALDYCYPPGTNRFFALWTNPATP